jgi:hypothetical protein
VAFDKVLKRPIAVLATLPLGPNRSFSFDRGRLRTLVPQQGDTLAVIVTYDEPTEDVTKYARYELRANGALQPGG